jgi:glycosyltransferase involved in cell wall biosynthesis
MENPKRNSKQLRIMFSSNAPWSTSGYGQQIKQILPRVAKAGYPTACVAFWGLQGGRIELDGITMFPKLMGQWGDDAVRDHQKVFNADIVITLQDIWPMDTDHLKNFTRWIPICPLDHEPVQPAVKERLNLAYRIITYSPFGQRELKRQGMHSTYIPHTVDTKIFKKQDKNAVRKKIGIPEDVFLFGMVAANKDNPPRKSFQQVLDAFAKFHKKHPKSAMYFHTYLRQENGFPIDEYAKFLGIQNAIYSPSPYELSTLVDTSDMPAVYGIMDTFVLPSTNEGFGVPLIESQACEVPVITNDFTAMKDLVIDGKTGWLTEVAYKRFTPLLSYIGIPSVDSIYDKMELAYKADLDKMGKAGRKFVKDNFDIDVVWKKHWVPFLERLEQEIYVDKKKPSA